MLASPIAECRHGIHEGSAEQYKIRTRSNGLRHIKAGADPAIDNERKPVTDGSANMRQLVKRVRRRIKLASCMI